jgi:hypothetical protein
MPTSDNVIRRHISSAAGGTLGKWCYRYCWQAPGLPNPACSGQIAEPHSSFMPFRHGLSAIPLLCSSPKSRRRRRRRPRRQPEACQAGRAGPPGPAMFTGPGRLCVPHTVTAFADRS